MSIVIRLALANEWDKLIDIYRREGQKEELNLVSKHAKIEFPEIGTRRIIWFAEDNEVIVGSIQLILDSDQKNLANGTVRGMIHHIRVEKDFQNTGIGSSLNQILEAVARIRKLKELTLEVEKSNIKARQIYEHWGYNYLCDGKDATEIVMIKQLL
jgi:ribosomal protein S18 acetylase RimI-like enzyme